MMQQIELSPSGRDFLVKLCGMLASDYDGERAAAAMKVSSFLRDRALTWNELIPEASAGQPIQHASSPQPRKADESRQARRWTDWRADLAMCRQNYRLLDRPDQEVVLSLSSLAQRPDSAQINKLAQIAKRLRKAGGKL